MLRWRLLIFFALLLLTVQAVDEPALAVQATDEQPPPTADPSDDDPLAGISDPQTLSQLLQWSLAHQDLDAQHAKAEAIREQTGQPPGGGDGGGSSKGDELPAPAKQGSGPYITRQPLSQERRAELDELAQQMMPDQVALMRENLALSNDVSLPMEDREAGLLNLEELVGDIDNARDLKSIGGFPEVVALLASEEPSLQAAAAWVLGSAVKNHHELQVHLLGERALPSLLALLESHTDIEVRAKALYAASALLRNCPEAQLAFGAAGGVGVLSAVLGEGNARLVRKALALVTDLLREQRAEEEAVGGERA